MTDDMKARGVPELLPCPFCGEAAEIHNYILEGAVRCVGCPAAVVRQHSQYSEDDGLISAIAAWNRRAALSDHPTVKQMVAEAEALGMERAAKACDRRAGNASDFDRYTRRAAGMCAADIRAEAAAIRGETT